MKLNLFALACLVAVIKASPKSGSKPLGSNRVGSGEARLGDHHARTDVEKFMGWATKTGKSFKTTGEFDTRLSMWKSTDERIKAANDAAAASGNPDAVRLKHNAFSDMTPDERKRVLGLRGREQELQHKRQSQQRKQRLGTRDERDEREHRGGRHLSSNSGVDWAADGFTGPVKDQGDCGSCYAFASNTVLEATIALRTGKPYQRLSEQQIVDCSNEDFDDEYWNAGCDGGYMSESWLYKYD